MEWRVGNSNFNIELKISLSCKFCSESKFTPQIYILMQLCILSHSVTVIKIHKDITEEDYFKGYNSRLYLCSYIKLPVLGMSQNDHWMGDI